MGYKPVNKYLPPRARRDRPEPGASDLAPLGRGEGLLEGFFRWADRVLGG
jgi:hypothetical protein